MQRADPLLGDGAKVFGLRIQCRTPNEGGMYDQPGFSHSFGYAFAGSTLMGQNGFLAVSAVLGDLASPSGYVLPLSDVVSYVHRYLAKSFQEFGFVVGPDALFEVAIFGHCHSEGRLLAYHLRPELCADDVWRLGTERIVPNAGFLLYLGVRRAEVVQRLEAALLGPATPDRMQSRAPMDVIKELIDDAGYASIGGDLQLGIADAGGYNHWPLSRPATASRPAAYTSFLGRPFPEDERRVGQAILAPRSLTYWR